MATKTEGFLPTPKGKRYKSIGSGAAQTSELSALEKDTIRRIRGTRKRKTKS